MGGRAVGPAGGRDIHRSALVVRVGCVDAAEDSQHQQARQDVVIDGRAKFLCAWAAAGRWRGDEEERCVTSVSRPLWNARRNPPCTVHMQLEAWAVLSLTWNFSPSQKSFSASGPATSMPPHAYTSSAILLRCHRHYMHRPLIAFTPSPSANSVTP